MVALRVGAVVDDTSVPRVRRVGVVHGPSHGRDRFGWSAVQSARAVSVSDLALEPRTPCLGAVGPWSRRLRTANGRDR